MEEIWKDIPDFPGYQASTLGRVRSHNKVTSSARFAHREWKDRILKPKVSRKDKCSRLSLWKDGKCHDVLVHRIVADTFLGKMSDTKMTVNHKDGNRQNNCVENLEWMTREDNIRHGFDHGLYPMKKTVIVGVDGEKIEFPSMSAASRFLGHASGYVHECNKRGYRCYSAKGEMYEVIIQNQHRKASDFGG